MGAMLELDALSHEGRFLRQYLGNDGLAFDRFLKGHDLHLMVCGLQGCRNQAHTQVLLEVSPYQDDAHDAPLSKSVLPDGLAEDSFSRFVHFVATVRRVKEADCDSSDFAILVR